MRCLFTDVLGGTSRTKFLTEHWNKQPLLASLAEDELLRDGFCDGELSAIIAECRKPDNSEYSTGEREDMERELDEHARTLNLPYCFCSGARELHDLAVDAFGDLANDIEVGVYMSKAGGDVAEWHCDNNHNITIQLTGAKDWYVLPGGDRRAEAPRGKFDPPRNAAEQAQLARCMPHLSGAQCYRLEPGSVLYLPPGDWHRVVPVEGGSLSVDIRVGHLTAFKWLSESVFAALANDGVVQPGSDLPRANTYVCPDLTGVEMGSMLRDLVERAKLTTDNFATLRVPRAIPSEDAHSDGLHRGATLAFLEERGFLDAEVNLSSGARRQALVVGVSSLCAMTLKRRPDDGLVVQLVAVSALTNSEYCRFSLFCEGALYAAVQQLSSGPTSLAELCALCAKPATVARFLVLVRCLLHANVLYTRASDGSSAPCSAAAKVGGGGAASPPTGRAEGKRKRSGR